MQRIHSEVDPHVAIDTGQMTHGLSRIHKYHLRRSGDVPPSRTHPDTPREIQLDGRRPEHGLSFLKMRRGGFFCPDVRSYEDKLVSEFLTEHFRLC